MSVKSILFERAATARQFLELVWPEWQAQTCRAFCIPVPQAMSTGTCGRSSTFLAAVMREVGVEAQVEHGWFCKNDPAVAESDSPRHAWITVAGYIVDITADQFGAPPVLITESGDSRYELGTDTADATAKARRSDVLATIWDQWLRSRERF